MRGLSVRRMRWEGTDMFSSEIRKRLLIPAVVGLAVIVVVIIASIRTHTSLKVLVGTVIVLVIALFFGLWLGHQILRKTE